MPLYGLNSNLGNRGVKEQKKSNPFHTSRKNRNLATFHGDPGRGHRDIIIWNPPKVEYPAVRPKRKKKPLKEVESRDPQGPSRNRRAYNSDARGPIEGASSSPRAIHTRSSSRSSFSHPNQSQIVAQVL